MRKTLSLLLSLALVTTMFTGCAGEDSSVADTTEAVIQSATETTAATESKIIDTNENLLTVTITLPASVFEGEDMTNYDFDAYAAENGFLSAKLNEDNTVSVTMTKAKHNALLEESTASIDSSWAEMVESDDTPYIKEIAHNDDFSEISVKVVRTDYEDAVFDITPFSVGISAMFYQQLLDMEYHVEVSMIDVDTSEVISTTIYPDAFE